MLSPTTTAGVHPFSPRAWVLTWIWTATLGTLFLVLFFVLYGVVERRWLAPRLTLETLHWLHVVRGMGASVGIGTWTFVNVWRMRARYEAAFAEAYRRLEAAMEQRTRDLVAAQATTKQLEAQTREHEKLAALGVLASGIAHDIANPLASMSSELEMLEDETDLARIRESLGVARTHIDRISRTLRDMTDFARRRSDERSLVMVADAVDDALRMVRHDPRARKTRIRTAVEPGLRLVEDHLVMVLVNLLLNAFDAMPSGGELTIAAERAPTGIHLCVRDTGCGMTEEVRRRATEPLFTTKGVGRGTGLGLSVSLEIVESAGGRLEIESAPAAGTTIHLFLPDTEVHP
jgi:signal transduction histidine kinase